MRDGCKARLHLSSFQKINGIVFYKLTVELDGHAYQWQERYSLLRQFSEQLPSTSVKFPPKSAVRSLMCSVTKDDQFLCERLDLMRSYFEAVSSSSELRHNGAFLRLCTKLRIESGYGLSSNCMAPTIKGMKLKPLQRKADEQIFVIV